MEGWAMKDRQDNVIQFKPRRKKLVAGLVAVILVILLVVLLTCFHIERIEVEGNQYYSEEDILKFVHSNGYIDNSILLMVRNHLHHDESIPFIAKLDMQYLSAHEVRVTVYEKAVAGCVQYMNEYVYFDQDGYVLEISQAKFTNAPCVYGLSFSKMELHEKLPVEDKKRFKLILRLTQLISKYQLQIDAIRFTSKNEIVLEHGSVKVELGDGSIMEEQLVDLNQILEGLEGKRGTLNMRDFKATSGKASFKEKK